MKLKYDIEAEVIHRYEKCCTDEWSHPDLVDVVNPQGKVGLNVQCDGRSFLANGQEIAKCCTKLEAEVLESIPQHLVVVCSETTTIATGAGEMRRIMRPAAPS
ncbi:hypothetical protein IAQ61_001649 [Plenodomus lingam]|uniref:uncharacterized protein n=1 Tax=Leptosphaeria maculans TaxID=5022 RepID=UPI0033227B60|nr:hypothetical protein IAQ61_001649 [Plenodomus lingam]